MLTYNKEETAEVTTTVYMFLYIIKVSKVTSSFYNNYLSKLSSLLPLAWEVLVTRDSI